MRQERPTGTVSFLFTDVEGSTRLWEEHPEAAARAMARHDEMVRTAITENGGCVFSTAGDAFAAAFWTPSAAVDAAVEAQRRLSSATWTDEGPVMVRMGVHTGTADERDGDYFGPTLNRAARLMSAAHGGQIVVSAAAQRLVPAAAARPWALRELGQFRLKDLAAPELVFQVVGAGLATSFPPLRTLSARTHNLPLQLTSFLGREELVREVVDLLGEHRLVTLVGGGGSGKTRLAVQAAAEVIERFDGVYLAELGPLRDPAQVVSRVIESVGYVAAGLSADAVDHTLVDRVAEQQLLIVLDNCEHLVDECARLSQLLVSCCPNVRVLATSRQPLGVPGERLHAVGGLEVPDPGATATDVVQSAAGTLFIDRARAVRTGFEVTDANAPTVAAICRQVEGLPLAIELAAARVRALAPADIAERLAGSLRVLATSARVGDPRHRTLEACLAWSFDTLQRDETAVLRRLSVFAGGASLDACSVVCAGDDLDASDVEEHLTTLVDRSLVQVDEAHDRLRYRLHELVRQYAAQRLTEAGETSRIRDRHLDWCADLVRLHSPGLRSLATLASVEPLLAEADNLAIAVAWALDRKHRVALVRILGGGGEMWAHVGRMRQLGNWWTAALPLLPEAPDEEFPANRLALSLLSAAAATGNNGRYPTAFELIDRALGLVHPASDAALFGRWLSLAFRSWSGEAPQGLLPDWEVLAAETAGAPTGYGTHCMLGMTHLLTGAVDRAADALSAVFDWPSDGLEMWAPTALALRGVADVAAGRTDEGLALLDDVSRRAESATTHWRYFVLTLDSMGRLVAGHGRSCRESVIRALRSAYDSSMYWSIVCAVEVAALLAARLGERQLAVDALAALDGDLAQWGGRPFSGWPGTALHRIRAELTSELRLDELRRRPATVLEICERLRRRFEERT